ncbi:hypothetical protein JHN63_05545 [Streptomyces sp. MBT65]|uniref:hypothetical protein n=1 Tax=Streptomyces sp. MBT65 TaxID=1488395 RepID=UPI001909E4DF|nr:hypothetical protein [Streptomyces sp. MBT65]MBK3573293.1 hypothetical protein [Streptomyces sp. MBT65]
MRRGLTAVAVLVAVTAGCGTEDGGDTVVAGTPPATPYAGPLYVPATDSDKSGAAGRALECDGKTYESGGADAWSKGDGGRTPEGGLRTYFDIEQPDVPRTGYRVERRADGRVLFSYDVDGRTKVAVVVAKDQKNRPGWGPETSASCDPAELPASFTEAHGYEIWTDKDGKRVPTTVVSSSVGAAHCDWQKAHFLQTGEGKKGRLYARDPDKVLPSEMLTAAYDGDVRLPASARDTGYRYQDWQLWLTPDASKAYVRTPDAVEAWPALKHGAGCL